MIHCVYVLLGGNMGDTRSIFAEAHARLGKYFGRIWQFSPLYQTEPWGMQAETFFINQALCLSSKLLPQNMIQVILQIENDLGRKRTKGTPESRLIDIDLLFIDDMKICEPGLEVPHPRLHQRRFALQPLCDIAPDLHHPVFNTTIKELLDKCDDPSLVVRLPGIVPD